MPWWLAVISFLSQYSLLAKIGLVICFAAFFAILIFAKHPQSSTIPSAQEPKVDMSTKIGEVKGYYIAGDKNIYEGKKEITPEEKLRQEKESDPSVNVQINKKDTELLINIDSKKHVSSLAISIPVLGKIINIHDYNSVTDAEAPLKQILGSQTENSQNTVEFLIENIKPNSKLSYKVIFKPMDKNVYIGGTDRYKVSYTWDFNGNVLSKEKWISFETGKEVSKPSTEVKAATIYNRALTPEEIKKLYEQGPPRQKVD